jgi:hypothetical protein
MWLGAVALAIALGALVATDAGAMSKLAWAGAATAALLLAVGPIARSALPAHLSVGLLALLLPLRQDGRLMLAPLYGAVLLLIAEVGTRSVELRSVSRAGPGVIAHRAIAVLSLAAVGACGAAAAAIAVTVAPARSLLLTGLGAAIAVAGVAAVTLIARNRHSRLVGSKSSERVQSTERSETGGRRGL